MCNLPNPNTASCVVCSFSFSLSSTTFSFSLSLLIAADPNGKNLRPISISTQTIHTPVSASQSPVGRRCCLSVPRLFHHRPRSRGLAIMLAASPPAISIPGQRSRFFQQNSQRNQVVRS